MSPLLTVDRFDEFFAAVNDGKRPFPWQRRLLSQLAAPGQGGTLGEWPELLALPTASGKTSVVDIAVYALAMGLPVPRRIFFVVDRRIVVQQAAKHAEHLADQLKNGDGIAREVEVALIAQCASTPSDAATQDPEVVALRVAELRGAIEQDRSWAMRPDVPTIIATTVDQIGSRLLFRGYGVSDRMRPIHAGLVGNDALILLDEVHLARPFAALLSRIKTRFREQSAALPDRWQIVELSATPGVSALAKSRKAYEQKEPNTPELKSFDLNADDYADPVLSRRLSASKPIRTVSLKAPADAAKAAHALVESCVQETSSLLKDERIKSIGVIVNRVRVAASVAAKLESLGVEVRLITGRMRGEDRQSVLNEIDQRITSGVKVSSQNRPFVVVATQTIEVGADFDFDLIVTECASIDALIQRFGRADRLGNLDSRLPMRDRPSNVIIGSDRSIGSDDPVYRTAMGSTWSWLRDRDTDFGFTNLKAALPDGTEREQMSVPPVKYPILLSTHMARLIRTSRTPDADIDIAPFLHGFRLGEDADVEIVWRADLSEQLLHEADERGRGVAEPVVAEEVMDLIAAVPLSRGESLSVPISQARSWLRREGPSEAEVEADRELNDVEGSAMPGERPRGWMRPVIRWRGDDSIVTTNSGHLRPGDTVVVPAHYGGISNGTWDPLNTDTVPDVAFAAGLKAGRFRLRLSPALLVPKNRVKESGPTGEDLSQAEIHHLRRNELLLDVDADTDLAPDRIPTPTPTPGYVEAIEADPVTILRDWLEQAPSKFRFDEQVLACLHELWKELSIANIHVVASEWGPVYVLSDKVPTAANLNDEIDSEPGRSCNTGSMYELDRHLDDVKRWADRLSQACGLEPAYVSDLAKAGELHDLGKADPRFQSILREGQVAAGQPPLAKSAIPAQDRSRSARAGNQSGYPPGLRHELASVALLLEGGADPIPGAFDPVLVKYLIASHHGYSRPFAPVQLDRQSVQIKYDGKAGSLSVSSDHQLGVLGSELPEDFWDLVEHYGYFGLAWLETILRLADHGASREIDRTQTNPVRPSKGSQK